MVGMIFELPILKGLDRSLGILLGLLEGSIIICLIIELMQLQSVFLPSNIIENSKIAMFFINYVLPSMELQMQQYIR